MLVQMYALKTLSSNQSRASLLTVLLLLCIFQKFPHDRSKQKEQALALLKLHFMLELVRLPFSWL